jgi:DNA repair protein RadC
MTAREGDAVIASAVGILEARLKKDGPLLENKADAMQYCTLKYGELPYEQMSCLFLDSDHRLISTKEMFRGTLETTAVFPREVMREAIAANAWGVVLCHNHPGSDEAWPPKPSEEDLVMTKTMSNALRYIDVKVLDHIIVKGAKAASMGDYLKKEKQAGSKEAMESAGDVHTIEDEDSITKVVGVMPPHIVLALTGILLGRLVKMGENLPTNLDDEDLAIAKAVIEKVKEARQIIEKRDLAKDLPKDKDGKVDPSQMN